MSTREPPDSGGVRPRFDHLVIAVPDLPAAVDWYGQSLGFAVTSGGRHTGKGTQNALMVLETGYLELIATVDEAEARSAHRGRLVDYLHEHGAGFAAYAVEVDDIDELAKRCAQAGLSTRGPFAMQRVQPDGTVVSWRLLVPGGNQYREWWPFFIQWDTPRRERFGAEALNREHPNGVRAVDELTIVVRELSEATQLCSSIFGLTPAGQQSRSGLGADSAAYELGEVRLTFVAPTGSPALRDVLQAEGQGPYEVALTVSDRERLDAGVAGDVLATGASGEVRADPPAPARTRIVFRARSSTGGE